MRSSQSVLPSTPKLRRDESADQKSEIRNQKSEIRCQRAEVRHQTRLCLPGSTSSLSLNPGNGIISIVRATKFEFEKRFWIITGIYAVGFSLSNFDHVRAITALRHLIAPSLPSDNAEAIAFAQVVIAAGALLVFLAAALRTWAAAYLRTDVVHDTAQHSEALVADGPFRYTRNPLYLANLPMAAGIGVLTSRLGWVFLLVASGLFLYRLISREEEALQQSQGESYRSYLEAVPALLAFAHAPSTGGKSRAAMGSGVCWRKLRLVLRRGGIMPRHQFERKTRKHRVSPWICSSFYRHSTCAKTCKKGASRRAWNGRWWLRS
jgi:protein-S-isoprenylcysteine O-methyltransferase Ste14